MNLENFETCRWKKASEFVPAGHKIGRPKPLFKKIEDEIIKKEKEELYKNLKDMKI